MMPVISFDFGIFYSQSDHVSKILTSVLYVGGKPSLVTLDYQMHVDDEVDAKDDTDSQVQKKGRLHSSKGQK